MRIASQAFVQDRTFGMVSASGQGTEGLLPAIRLDEFGLGGRDLASKSLRYGYDQAEGAKPKLKRAAHAAKEQEPL
jgi:hypothetical protein